MNGSPPGSPWSRGLARRLKILVPACGLVLILPGSARYLAGTGWDALYWVVDLLVHWQAMALCGVLTGSLLLAILTRKRRWLTAWGLALLPGLSAAPQALPMANGPATRPLEVVTANVHFGQSDLTPLRGYAGAPAPADLVILVELGLEASQKLASWPEWPHQLRLPRQDPFGLALLSRHPITGAEQEESPAGVPRVRVRLDWHGTILELVLLHPMPPLNAAYARERDATLAQEALRLARVGKPGLMVGDFNATPWSGALEGPARAGLHRASPLFPGTWPAGAFLLGIPIDQVLATDHWQVESAGVGPDIGSDHRPVRVRLHCASRCQP